jgi:hypothetical protein
MTAKEKKVLDCAGFGGRHGCNFLLNQPLALPG